MKEDCYEFTYSTKTKKGKTIAYYAATHAAALRRFRKNVRYVGQFSVCLDCGGFKIWTGMHR